MATDTLPPMQQRFAEEYPVDLNGLRACVRAGYSERTAQEQASRLLSKVKVQEAIQVALAERSKRTELKADDVVKGFAAIAFTDLRDVLDWTGESVTLKEMDDISDAAHAAISEITQVTNKDGDTTIRVKLHNKASALDSLGKHLPGFFSSTTRHEGSIDVNHTRGNGLSKYTLEQLDALLAAMDAEKKPEPAAPESLPEPGILDADYKVSDDTDTQGEHDAEAQTPDAPESEPKPTEVRILDAPESEPESTGNPGLTEPAFDMTAQKFTPPPDF